MLCDFIPEKTHNFWFWICTGSVYRHPERVHVLPPPELTRLRTLPRRPMPPAAEGGKAGGKGKQNGVAALNAQQPRDSSPIRKLPLPEIFYTNAELEEKSDLTTR